jgi:DNA-directed RNA polymerase subunit RPC12/RpoP
MEALHVDAKCWKCGGQMDIDLRESDLPSLVVLRCDRCGHRMKCTASPPPSTTGGDE